MNTLLRRKMIMNQYDKTVYGATIIYNGADVSIPFYKYKSFEVCFFSTEHNNTSKLGFANTNQFYNNAGISTSRTNDGVTMYFPNPTTGMINFGESIDIGNLYSIRYKWPVNERPFYDFYINGVFNKRVYKTGEYSDGIPPCGSFKFNLSQGISIVYLKAFNEDTLVNNYIVNKDTNKFYDTITGNATTCIVKNLTKLYNVTTKDTLMPYPTNI